MVRRMLGAAKAEIAVARLFIAVEQHGFVAAVAWRADDQRILLPLEHARVVGPGTVGCRDAAVVFLDAAPDLAKDRVRQSGMRGLEGFGEIRIFGFDILAD